MIVMKLVAENPMDLRDQLREILNGGPLNAPPGVLQGGYGIGAEPWDAGARFEHARQLGFRQGFERGLQEGKAGDVAKYEAAERAVSSAAERLVRDEVGPEQPEYVGTGFTSLGTSDTPEAYVGPEQILNRATDEMSSADWAAKAEANNAARRAVEEKRQREAYPRVEPVKYGPFNKIPPRQG